MNDTSQLVEDNSAKTVYRSCLEDLEGFRCLDFFGMGPQNHYAGTTSVFLRTGVVPEGRW